jgi:hypothetical protein
MGVLPIWKGRQMPVKDRHDAHPDRLALERELLIGAGLVSVPWDQRPVLNLPTAAVLLGGSVPWIYQLADGGMIELVTMAGRTMVKTEGVVRLIRAAGPWQPSNKERSRAAGAQRARVALDTLKGPVEDRDTGGMAQLCGAPTAGTQRGAA